MLFLLQAGYPADLVFDLTVDTINVLRNRSVAGGQLRPADPEFTRMVQVLRKAQVSGHVGIRVQHEKERPESVALFFRDKCLDPELAGELAEVRRTLGLDPELAGELAEVRRTLGLDPARREFRVVFGAAAANPDEIAILSRSVIRILTELSTFVEVPVDHQANGVAQPIGEPPPDAGSPFCVLSGTAKPRDPFAAVCCEGRWFWIEKSDFRSKRTLAYLLVLLALSDTGSKENLPVITIQAN